MIVTQTNQENEILKGVGRPTRLLLHVFVGRALDNSVFRPIQLLAFLQWIKFGGFFKWRLNRAVKIKASHFKDCCCIPGSRGVKFVRKNYPSYILPCKIHNFVILINKFAQCNLCESNVNMLYFSISIFALAQRTPYRPPY